MNPMQAARLRLLRKWIDQAVKHKKAARLLQANALYVRDLDEKVEEEIKMILNVYETIHICAGPFDMDPQY